MRKSLLVLLSLCLLSSPFASYAQTADLSKTQGQAVKAVKANKMLGVRRIEPAKDIEPKFSDPVRVGVLLKIIENVYYGRPLQFPKDGTVFLNKEGRLPPKNNGYYREYTVLPPEGTTSHLTVGDREFEISPPQGHRGAERLIIGGGEVLYYTPDHYRTFIQLQVLR